MSSVMSENFVCVDNEFTFNVQHLIGFSIEDSVENSEFYINFILNNSPSVTKVKFASKQRRNRISSKLRSFIGMNEQQTLA